VGSEVEDFAEWVEVEGGSRRELYARLSTEYCTRLEVEHFESEGMHQLMEARMYWYSFRKVTERKVS
jgi:hypothetical protein